MSALDRTLEAFAAWLEERDEPPVDRGTVRGILMLANGGQVTEAHVAESVDLAREAGCGQVMLDALAAQGALLREFQADAGVPEAPRISTVYIMGPAEPDAIVAPSPGVVALAPKAADPPASDAAAEDAPKSPGARPRVPVLAGIGLAAIALLAGVWYIATSEEPAPPPRPARAAAVASDEAPPRGPQIVRGSHLLFELDHLALQVELPLGWQHAEDADRAQPGPLGGTVRSSLLYSGDNVSASRHTLFLATTDLPEALEQQLPVADDLLLSIAQFVEYQIASKVQADGIYRAGECEIARDILGRPSARCGGEALGLTETATVLTYVRLERGRALIALFVADESVQAPQRVADATLDSLR